ncbi:hypothetical protein KEM56_006391 [Ascosphaera pollenicola]|nr:hypothetical protein KEM56_006391 [Ascosphaera pollenicola]
MASSSKESLPLSQRIPRGAWDSHMHIVEPTRYPIAKVAKYVPNTFTLSQALEFESSHGIEKIVIVQPSFFGTDNSNLIDVLKELGPERGRGVVWIDSDNVDYDELQRWHELGVRGLRLNFVSIESMPTSDYLADVLRKNAEIAKKFDWVIQVYIPLHLFKSIADVVPTLPVRLVVDHFGDPDFKNLQLSEGDKFDPYSLPGFSEMVGLLKQGNTYVKVSGSYRASGIRGQLESQYIDVMLKELLHAAKEQLVFATDWPHTRFEGLDIKPFTEKVLKISHEVGGDDCVDMVFRRNAEALWSPRAESS